jgi:hypothetical protein
MSRLTAHEFPIHKILSSDYEFSIPEYQRPYSWRPPQALQLLADLSDVLERGASDEPYFLGSLVLVKSDSSPRAEVIDGQQRLTTLTLLLAVLRHHTADPALGSSFDRLIFEPGEPLLDRLPKPRLTLRARDNDFFRRFVQGGELDDLLALPDGTFTTDAQRNLRDNVKALSGELASWPDERRSALARLVTGRTYLVTVSTSDIASAHRIFSVMNSRGLDLSPADIFKSQVIGDLPPELADVYAARWEDAEDALGRDAFQELFQHIRMIFAKTRAQRELLQEFPVQVLNAYVPGRSAEFVDEVLLPYADAASTVDAASYSWPHDAERVNAILRRLNLLDNSDWKPVAIWILTHHREDPSQLVELLQLLERLAAVLLLRRVYSTPRGTRYGNLLRSLEAGDGVEASEFAFSDEEKSEAVLALRGSIYEVAPLRKFVLFRLNELISSTPLRIDASVMSVEHVLPQRPRPDSEWSRSFTEDEHAYWVHKLGNLVLLDRKKNSEAQNYDFEDKKSRYFRTASGITPFPLTVDVLDTAEWTPAVLQDRQGRLIALLASAWGLEYDESGRSLLHLDDTDLVSRPGPMADRPGGSGRRVLISDLIAEGLLETGTVLTWNRTKVGATFSCTVTEGGKIQLADGRVFDTPSRAAKEAAGVSAVDGWEKWLLPSGEKLAVLFHEFKRRHADGVLADPLGDAGSGS